jgi:hypothetical protein
VLWGAITSDNATDLFRFAPMPADAREPKRHALALPRAGGKRTRSGHAVK